MHEVMLALVFFGLPVLFAVALGCAIAMEWIDRERARGRR